jgi:ribosomal protein S18 acetylase RimI-like enzyme
LVELMSDLYAESSYPLDRSWAASSFRQLLRDTTRGAIWIGRPIDQIAGYVVLVFKHSMEHGGLAGVIDDLYVSPNHRGQRLGSALVRAAIDYCRALSAVALEVEVGASNVAAVKLYESCGLCTDGDDRRHLSTRINDGRHAD